ncbi:MAG: hypothetical protein L0387_34620 [Acidobacteria bacterium]|nr:hypothetical protein [Acidobacteriota bacterium]
MSNSLDCALALNCLLDLGPGSLEPDWDWHLGEMSAYLVREQNSTALWPALPLFVDHFGNVYGSIQATTAICLEALSKYRRFGRRGTWAPRTGSRPVSRMRHPWKCNPPGAPKKEPRPGTLEDTLRAVAQCMPPILIPPDGFRNMRAVARCLPSSLTSGFGLECRLGGNLRRTDLLFCITKEGEGREVLAGCSDNVGLPAKLLTAPGWKRLRDFSRQWASPESLLWADVTDLWLEFDVEGMPPRIPVPNIFFCLREMRMPAAEGEAKELAERIQAVVSAALPLLRGGGVTTDIARDLEICFKAVPAGAHVYAIGVMLARSTEAVRLCIKDIERDHLLDYLGMIGWTGSYRELRPTVSMLSQLVDRIHLDIDVGTHVMDGVGLECSFKDHKQPADEPRWQAFIARLVEAGLCTKEKGDVLLAWPGKFHCFEELQTGIVEESYFSKMLSHIKIYYGGREMTEAKGYIGAWRVFGRRGRHSTL